MFNEKRKQAREENKNTLKVMMNTNDYSNINDVHSCHNIKVYARSFSMSGG